MTRGSRAQTGSRRRGREVWVHLTAVAASLPVPRHRMPQRQLLQLEARPGYLLASVSVDHGLKVFEDIYSTFRGLQSVRVLRRPTLLTVSHLVGSMYRMCGRQATNHSTQCRVPHIPSVWCLRFYAG